MNDADKRTRRLLYCLTELEAALQSSARIAPAESISNLLAHSRSTAPEAFLHECRDALEAILLGERDLGTDLIGQIMDAVAIVDSGLAG